MTHISTPAPPSIRVHLVEPDNRSRSDLLGKLSVIADVTLTRCSSTPEEALGAIQADGHEVLLLDLALPDRGASQIVRRLFEIQSTVGVVAMTLHDERQCLLQYLSWGVRGFVLRPVDIETLAVAIRHVARGARFVDPLLPHCLVSKYAENPSATRVVDQTRLQVLTAREREICRYLASGYTNAEVADVLHISKRTVETHRAAIMSKVGVKSRAQLVHFAIEQGIWPDNVSHNPSARHLDVTPGE